MLNGYERLDVMSRGSGMKDGSAPDSGLEKPERLFDRDSEWSSVASFVDNDSVGAQLGLVYGRRRMGKTLLLELLAQRTGGFFYSGLQQSSRQNLADIGRAYAEYRNVGRPVVFPDWEAAIADLLALGEQGHPVLIVLDEFPFLIRGAGELPSLLQRALSPTSRAKQHSRARVILCGSVFSVMSQLVSGTAPLRGRLVREIVLKPFDYRVTADFWQLSPHWELAFKLHALCGGTPAYRDFCFGRFPRDEADFDAWVAEVLLNPGSPFFREAQLLVSEDPRIQDLGLYFSILAALSEGRTRRGEIASALGRKEGALSHPLRILAESQLVTERVDPLRKRRNSYQIAEPLLRLSQLVLAPRENQLVIGQQAQVWSDATESGLVAAKIYGPHFEDLARQWTAFYAAEPTLRERPRVVGSSVVSCKEHRVVHEIDVVAVANNQIVAIGEAKWTQRPVGVAELVRLRHIRDLLGAGNCRLLLFSRSGFTADLSGGYTAQGDYELVDLERLYAGS